ncbi:hypothetical protein Kisp01_71320 [Kineosporia sp. NBRC 101677]|uniref:hypothetical protein n=1 Tax=Kineosporia sp. NBRC 101677 TaxID=3032197 RepID=UPI0024A0FA7D|nr:hypothetical protein [Kineosporia sp. NBRC 101677]GLY20118.1 hypothetical protein Kisp01_71320 [Kineosporia sp. NBRC 101677]
MNRKTTLIASLTAVAVSCGTAGAVAAVRSAPVPNVFLAAPVQASRTYVAGPEATYERFTKPYPHVTGGIGEVEPLVAAVPDQAKTYDALVTVSFRYSTKGSGPFTVEVNADTKLGASDDLVTSPKTPAPITPSAKQASGTVQFVVPALKGGKTYRFQPIANTKAPKKAGKNAISTSGVVLTVQLTPRT